MNIDKLEALADAAEACVKAYPHHDYHMKVNPATIKSLIALCRMQNEVLKKVNTAYDRVSDGLQSDLENGVKRLNQQAAQKFNKEYPGVVKALDALFDASVSSVEALAAYERFNNGE